MVWECEGEFDVGGCDVRVCSVPSSKRVVHGAWVALEGEPVVRVEVHACHGRRVLKDSSLVFGSMAGRWAGCIMR